MTVMIRCAWAKNDLSIKYHDCEWGVPVHDDRILFEFLILEGAQAGLSWDTILAKRPNYRSAFSEWDVEKVAGFSEKRIAKLLENPGIVRNRLKISSAINNARRFIEVQSAAGSFAEFLWDFVNGEPIVNKWKTMKQVPASTKLSDRISAELRSRGFSFVGSTIVYAYMQAVGLINDHITSCVIHSHASTAKHRCNY